MTLSAASVAAQIGGAVVAGDAVREFANVSIDTRTLKAGDLYFGIRGERFDGAEFAVAAIDAGATGIVVPRGWTATGRAKAQGVAGSAKALAERAAVIEVDDTTVAL